MKDIEHFTNQRIEVKVIEEFLPEPGEKAEPIAMGRQTIWGGLGKPPSREVMVAAAKAARAEMMDRIREKKGQSPSRGKSGGPGPGRHPRPNGDVNRDRQPGDDAPNMAARPPRPQADRNGPRRPRNDRPQGPRLDAQGLPIEHSDDDFQPRENAHLGTHNGVNAFGHKNQNKATRQPDPTRTSVDLMSERRGGGGGRRRNGSSGGGGGGGGGFGGGRRGGGGGGRGGFPR